MKPVLVILLLFNTLAVHAQLKTDDLSDFIKKRNYIQLTDTAHLPKKILPYLHLITDNLSAAKYAAPAEIYVKAADIMDYATRLEIIVINLKGVQILKHIEDEAAKVKDTIINGHFVGFEHVTLGSPGGERQLVINKADGNITTYRFQ